MTIENYILDTFIGEKCIIQPHPYRAERFKEKARETAKIVSIKKYYNSWMFTDIEGVKYRVETYTEISCKTT